MILWNMKYVMTLEQLDKKSMNRKQLPSSMNLFPLKMLYKYLSIVTLLGLSTFSLHGQIDFEILSGDALICQGDSTLLSIETSMTIDSVVWSPTDGVRMPESLTTYVAPTVSTTYFATLYKDELTQLIRFQVDVFSSPDLGNDVTVCSNGSTLTFDLSNVEFPANYDLINMDGFTVFENPVNSNIFEVGINGTGAGTYDLIANSDDCSNQSDTIQVIVLAGTAATLDFDEEDATICIGSDVNLSVTPVANQTYQWFGNGVPISTATSISDTPTETTTYVISTIGLTCVAPTSDSVTITVNNDPAITLPENIQGCENDIIPLGNNIAQQGTTYSWEPAASVIDPDVVNAQLLVTQTDSFFLTANNGCILIDTIVVEMIPNDIEIPMDTLFLCKGDSIEITWTTNPGNDDVVWSTLDGGILNNVPSPFFVKPDDVITYIGTVENNGCTHMDTVTIQVDSLPPFLGLELIDMPPPICLGDTVLLQTIPVYQPFLYPNITYEWFTGESSGGSGDNYLTPDSLLQLLFIGEETTVFNRININGACIDTSSIDVEVVPILDVDVTPLDAVCPGSTITIMGQGTDPLNGDAVIPSEDIEWEWMVSSGSIEPEEGQFDPTVTVGSSTVNIMVTATHLGCPAMGEFALPVLSTPALDFPAVEVCPGEEVALNSGFVGPNYTFNWSSSAGDLNGQESSSNPIVNPNGTTIYSVTVTNSTVSGEMCTPVIDEVTVNVFPGVSSLGDTIKAAGCQGDNFTLSIPENFNGGPEAEYTWTLNPNSGTVPEMGSTITVNNVQENLEYRITLTNNCESDVFIGIATISVQIPPDDITIVCDPDKAQYGEGEGVIVSVDPSVDGVDYFWTSDTSGTFSVNPASSTVYTVPDLDLMDDQMGSDIVRVFAEINGCSVSIDPKRISIIDSGVSLPNLFVPGVNNEIFRIRVTGEEIEITNLQIYDRWGNKVYDNDNVEHEWDGNINGKPAPSEVYIYTVTYIIPGQDPVTESSDLTLLR